MMPESVRRFSIRSESQEWRATRRLLMMRALSRPGISRHRARHYRRMIMRLTVWGR